jgi:hypothetical protein
MKKINEYPLPDPNRRADKYQQRAKWCLKKISQRGNHGRAYGDTHGEATRDG